MLFSFWSHFGVTSVRLGSPRVLSRAENGIRYALCRLGVGLLNEVGIDILCGTDLCVSQSLGDTYGVCTGEVQDRCHTMTELVCVYMRQVKCVRNIV